MYPHLPFTNPRAVIINPNVNSEIISFFKERNIDIIYSKKAECINSSVAYHPDIQIAHIDDRLYVSAPEFFDYYKEKLSLYGVNVLRGNRSIQSNYPDDIAYNVLRVGETSFAKNKYTDEVCLFHLNSLNIKIIDVAQGYAKCNVCVIDKNSIITSDASIYKMAKENNVDALLISPGDIKLSGFEYGFIGGASFMLNKNTLCFLGDISHHKDYDKILDFVKKRSIDVLIISREKAEDFGSVILIF
ncbi:MAG: hypothetical protein E7396_05425 [Ruminococcaceae bacterium]|nr:hypothetical protein [Oscillospiraceae bacterium]